MENALDYEKLSEERTDNKVRKSALTLKTTCSELRFLAVRAASRGPVGRQGPAGASRCLRLREGAAASEVGNGQADRKTTKER